MNALPATPALPLTLSEVPRATFDTVRLVSGLGRLIKSQPKGDGHPVLVLPGYGATDGSTTLMRYFLRKIGYAAYALEAGRNIEGLENRIRGMDDAVRFREQFVEVTSARVRDIHRLTGERVSVVGWSMGGLYAFDVSQEVPELTRRVITLGAPFGDPRGTSMFEVMRRLSGSKTPLEAQNVDGWVSKARAPKVPTHIIYSDRDGIVGSEIARLPDSPLLSVANVDSSHLGFTLNAEALREVAGALVLGSG